MDDEFLKKICQSIVDISLSIAISFLIIWTLFSRVVMQDFSISPKINDWDFVLVNRLYKRLLPINRYDCIVFYLNNQENIKRIIGIPGDTLEYQVEMYMLIMKKLVANIFLIQFLLVLNKKY